MIPIAMTIAGSDSGGGAGIQADLKTFTALAVYGTTVITAITAQDSVSVHDVFVVPDAVVRNQMEAVFGSCSPRAVKVGMLGSRANVEVVAERLRAENQANVILDPVVASTSGASLLPPEAVQVLRDDLLRISSVVTPNMAEAALLTGRRVDDLSAMEEAARALHGMGAQNVLVTGGHLSGGEAIDVFYDGASIETIRRSRIEKNPHGTGCVLSAALAAHLALGSTISSAVLQAAAFSARAIQAGLTIGNGEVSNPTPI